MMIVSRQLALTLCLSFLTASPLVLAQQALSIAPPQEKSSSLPLQVRPVAGGLEVVSYSGTDGQVRRGDIISWIATPDSDNQVAVKTATSFEAEVLAKQAVDGSIALWVTRGNAAPDWIFLKLTAAPSGSPAVLPLIVRQGSGGVEVVTYNGEDGMLSKGDFISWVATPGVANQVAVDSPAKFEAEVTSKKGPDGQLALWVTRRNADPVWVIVDLSKTAEGSNPKTGGPLMAGPPVKGAPETSGTNNPSTDAADEASMLHVLYIHDPEAKDDSFRWGCEFDVYRMSSYLEDSIPLGMISAHSLATPNHDADGLLNNIRDYKNRISPNDTFLIYYSGHGSNDNQIGQTLDIRPGVKVARSDLRQAMQDSGARLCVLITDCCASGSKAPFRADSKTVVRPKSTYWNTSICRSLFFRHTGFVDVTSAEPGELAWSIGPTDENNRFIGKEPTDGGVFDNGGLFTTSLLEILAMHDGALKNSEMVDKQGRITWDSISEQLAINTESRFQRTIYPTFRRQRDKDKNKHQTVTFLSMGQPTGSALPTTGQSVLGVELVDGRNGVVAGEVDPDRTPAWVGIQPGDRLVSIRRLKNSYSAHFWMDKNFTGFEAPTASKSPDDLPFGYQPVAITSLNSFRQLTMPTGNSSSPQLSSGMWVVSVERNGVPTDVSVRIVEESHVTYRVYAPIYTEADAP